MKPIFFMMGCLLKLQEVNRIIINLLDCQIQIILISSASLLVFSLFRLKCVTLKRYLIDMGSE
ncbi:MAG TPA: hypothetical protein DCM38_04915 [Gammaproteobacteria bacterium]|nr:hypothetical protein [Gammaproteobacteria bacterium]